MSVKPSRIIEFSTLPATCAYLKDRQMRMEYKFIEDCPTNLSQSLVERGWRRFGEYYSRPNCASCNLCLSLRIQAYAYRFSKSAKRTIRKNSNTRFLIQKPTLTKSHLALYEKYHKHMEAKKGWKHYHLSANSYYELYVAGAMEFGKEVLYFVDNKLVGVDLIDFFEDGISSIYFFYDPDYAHLSLGRFSIYQQILIAQINKLPYIYLGYFVEDCESLNYKANYKPFEILQGDPHLDQTSIWAENSL
ncbi:MAG: arginyltransferase [Sulfurospirillum sp.]|nr:arginyltransferase [Sulfurospirillum sp.]